MVYIFIDNNDLYYNKEDRLRLAELLFSGTNVSINNMLRNHIYNIVDENDRYIIPYWVNKIMIGEKLIYDPEIEDKIYFYSSRLRKS